ncbi:MAG: hypothetical protein AAF502_19645 [Bacteroidota bacterium]
MSFSHILLSLILLSLVACQPDNPEKTHSESVIDDSYVVYWTELLGTLDIEFPAKEVHILLFKMEQKAEIWVVGKDDTPILLEVHDIETTSSEKGPLLYEGQPNFPEGKYLVDAAISDGEVVYLKPDFPNSFDQRKAKADKRKMPKEGFFIASAQMEGTHTAIMEENTLNSVINLVISTNHSEIIVFPEDPRPNTRFKPCYPCTEWYVELYSMLEETLRKY